MKSFLSLALLGIDAHYPPALFALRLAAQLSCAMLLVFSLFLLLSGASWPVSLYALLMLCLALLNLATLFLIKRSAAPLRILRLCAHISSALLPLAYVVGSYYGQQDALHNGRQVITVLIPSLLNVWAVEQSARFER